MLMTYCSPFLNAYSLLFIVRAIKNIMIKYYVLIYLHYLNELNNKCEKTLKITHRNYH